MQKNNPNFTVDTSVNFKQTHNNSISSTFSTQEFKNKLELLLSEQINKAMREQAIQALATQNDSTEKDSTPPTQEFKNKLELLLSEQITKLIKEQTLQALATQNDSTEKDSTASIQEFKNKLELLLSEQVTQQFEVEFKEEIENLLDNFQDSLAEKITLSTFDKMRKEILDDEERIVHTISNKLVDYYRGQLIDVMRHNKTGLSPRMEKSFKQEIEETNIYLGYRPSMESIKSSRSQGYLYPKKNTLNSIQQPTNRKRYIQDSLPTKTNNSEKETILAKQFISQLGVLTFLMSIFSAWFLYLVSPFLYLQNASIITIIAVLIINASISCYSEIKYFNNIGIYRSIEQEHTYFRFIFFAFKMFIISLLLGFVFLIDYNYHPMDFLYHTSTSSFWWIETTNQIFGFMQLWVSTATFMAVQYTLLGTGLILSIFSLGRIFMKKD